MEILYPLNSNPTHAVSKTIGIAFEYPKYKQSSFLKDLNLPIDTLITVIRENVGYNCEWSLARINDPKLISAEFVNKQFYILNSNLKNIGGKQTYKPICSEMNQINDTYPGINPVLKEIFVPYVDRRNGLYSVRIQVSYERILDMVELTKVLEDVYLEGTRILLASRGFMSDNDMIKKLRNQYYTFSFINKDLDLTIRRDCEPLTFTVSLPMNFFNEIEVPKQEGNPYYGDEFHTISFTNRNFVDKIDNIIIAFTNKAGDLENLLYPNKEFDSFNIDLLLSDLATFSLAAKEIFEIATIPINKQGVEDIKYFIGLDSNYELIRVRAIVEGPEKTEEIEFTEGILSMCRMRGDFNFKRVLYLLANDSSITTDSKNLDVLSFILKYIKYPTPVLGEEVARLPDNTPLPPELLKEFRINYTADKASCINLSDILGLTRDVANFSTSLSSAYHLFVPNDPMNQLTIGGIIDNFNTQLAQTQKYYTDNRNNVNDFKGIGISYNIIEGTSKGLSQYGQGLSQNLYSSFKDMPSTLNTIFYFFRRIRLEEIIFKKLLCHFKKLNRNDPEVARQLASIPFGVFNFVNYAISQRDLSGWDFVKALERGVYFDAELLCNDSMVYLLKSLRGFLQAGGVIFGQFNKFVSDLSSASTKLGFPADMQNPYQAIVKAVLKIGQRVLTDLIFDFIHDFLIEDCDDSLLDPLADYGDIFASHVPLLAGNGQNQLNSNKSIIKSNRQQILEKTFPEVFRELTYGPDVDYTVDLLDLLFADMKCLLSPTELINLLKGNPAKETIIIIKNLIRAKYSKDPNNLSYLLNDNKLILFFERLGMTLDRSLLDKVEQISKEVLVGTGREWIDICSDKNYEIRKNLISGKVPKDLGVLDDSNKRYLQDAKKLIEKIKSPPTTRQISALCPDEEDEQINELKDHLINNYKITIENIFSETLTVFTSESKNLPTKFQEIRQFIRKTSSDEVIGSLEYSTYNSDLGKNLKDSYDTKYRSGAENAISFKFVPKDRLELTDKELSDIFINSNKKQATFDPCSSFTQEGGFERFKKFLDEGKMLFEGWWRDFEDIDKPFSERDPNEKSDYYTELSVYSPELFQYVKNIPGGIFLLFSYDEDWDPGYEGYMSEDNYMQVRAIYYDKNIDDFRTIGSMIEWKCDDMDTQEGWQQALDIWSMGHNFIWYTGQWKAQYFDYSEVGTHPDVSQKDQRGWMQRYFPWIEFFMSRKDERLRSYYTTYVVKGDIIDKINARNTGGPRFNVLFNSEEDDSGRSVPDSGVNHDPTRFSDIYTASTDDFTKSSHSFIATIAAQWEQLYQPAIQTAQIYEKIVNAFNLFKEGGLFNIKTTYDVTTKEITKRIIVPKSGADTTVEYTDFIIDPLKANYTYDGANIDKILFFSLALQKIFKSALFKNYIRSFSSREEVVGHIFLTYDVFDEDNELVTEYSDDTGEEEPGWVGWIVTVATGGLYAPVLIYEYAVADPARMETIGSKDYKFHPKLSPQLAAEQIAAGQSLAGTIYYDIIKDFYLKYARFDFKNDIRYQTCNIFPHYLNLDYFLKIALENAKVRLCDNNLKEVPVEVLDEVLTNLTIRTYVTDFFIKGLPALSLLTRQQILELHNDQNIVDIIRKLMQAEMHLFTGMKKMYEKDDYYNAFARISVNNAFDKSKRKRPQFYLPTTPKGEDESEEDYNARRQTDQHLREIVEYYIRKEIKHFINYSLAKKILTPAEKSITDLVNEYLNTPISGFGSTFTPSGDNLETTTFDKQYDYVVKKLGPNLARSDESFLNPSGAVLKYLATKEVIRDQPYYVNDEFYSLFIYTIMSATADLSKKDIFMGTKSELAKIFLQRGANIGADDEKLMTQAKSKEDIVKFILEVAYSPNPSFKANGNFDYAKYIKFFLDASLEAARNITLTIATASDPIVKYTRIIQFIIATAQMVGWAFVPEESKKSMLLNAALTSYPEALTLYRINEGKSILPDILVGAIVSAAKKTLPSDVGIAYFLLDSYQYYKWIDTTIEEIDALREAYANAEDPCKPPDSTPEIVCDYKEVALLKDLLDRYEEGS